MATLRQSHAYDSTGTNKEALLWKEGVQVKLGSGVSAGPVKSVAVVDEENRNLTVGLHTKVLDLDLLCFPGTK